MALSDFYEKITIVERKVVSDGEGGYLEEYVDGVEFLGNITTDNSMQTRMAQQSGVVSLYTVTTSKNVPLKFADILKKGDKYYRITSNEIDSPSVSEIDIRQLQAENFTINN